MPFAGKPIIGLVGGIGSGKSFVARLFGEQGCLVIDSDALSREAHADLKVLANLRQIAGEEVVVGGKLDRRALARFIFSDDAVRQRVEQVLHPWIERRRLQQMQAVAGDPNVRAYVWDSPLLVETGLDAQCDHVVFVDAPRDVRLARVQASRGWTDDQLRAREARQVPPERKRERADAVLDGTADASTIRRDIARLLEGWLGRG